MKKQQYIDINYSYAIMWLNLFLSILIIFLHTDITKKLPKELEYAWYSFKDVVDVVSDAAVPCFFIISSYLLFRRYSHEKYKVIIISRIKSLLIPYVVWNLIAICYQWGIKVIKGETFQFDVGLIVNGTYNQPLWFLKTLFLFVLLSPIIFCLISCSKKSLIIPILFIILNFSFKFNYTSVFFWMPCYMLGTWFALYLKNIIEAERIVLTKFDCNYIKILIMILLVVIGFVLKRDGRWYYVYRMIIGPTLLYYVWKNPWKQLPHPYLQNSFFTFCSHVLFLGVVPNIVMRLVPDSFVGIIIGYLLSVFIIWGTTILVAQMIKEKLPFLYLILNGGRKERK